VKRTTGKPRARRGAAVRGGQDGELVQLLTPDGTRVDHPEFSVDLTSEELRGL
jgi:pyruvate dehydrogenase E1 component alpha subunit